MKVTHDAVTAGLVELRSYELNTEPCSSAYDQRHVCMNQAKTSHFDFDTVSQ